MKKRFLSAILFISFILIPIYAFAFTYVTDNITENETWDIAGTPYIVSGDIQVYPDVTLRILPGVEIRFDTDASLIIGGELIARGTPGNHITFTANSATPSPGAWGSIIFKQSAAHAKFNPGEIPDFAYDFDNHQVLLDYASGSILEYCIIEYGGTSTDIEVGDGTIKATEGSYPAIMHSIIRYSLGDGLSVSDYSGDSSIRNYLTRWFFFYDNIVEGCEQSGLNFSGHYGQGRVLISGNTIRNNGRDRTYLRGGISLGGRGNGIFLFNNQIINNPNVGIWTDSWGNSSPMFFLGHNSITHNYQGFQLIGNGVLLHNYIVSNQWVFPDDLYGGAGYMAGHGVLFNNSIQLNGANSGGHADGIALGASAVIRNNNLGNSVWDMQDIYMAPDQYSYDCDASSELVVDATENTWMTNDPSQHIYDTNDDFCLGTVNYDPVSAAAMIPDPFNTHPTLIAPADNAYVSGVLPTFSWNPVPGANRYLLVTFGHTFNGNTLNNIEIVNSTSKQISFGNNYASNQFIIHWYVVAGDDDGWTLPSEVRKLILGNTDYDSSMVLVQGKIVDENGTPVPFAYLRGVGNPSKESVSDENGDFGFFTCSGGGGCLDEFKIIKAGYPKVITFERSSDDFDIASDLTIISSDSRKDMYTEAGIPLDPDKGTVAGIVVDSNDNVLTGAEVFLTPYSGSLYYLDDNGDFDPTLTKTSTSGKFVILGVLPGDYQISATLDGYTFSPEITVEEDAITVDALIGEISTGGGNDGGNGSGGGGGGGGGGIFGDIIKSSVIGYHLDGITTNGVQIYMPVTQGFKALKGAQEYVRNFAPSLAEFVRKCLDFLEQKADANKEGFLYKTGTYIFPILGKITEKSLELIGEQKYIAKAYYDTTISTQEFKKLEKEGLAIAPKIVKNMERSKQEQNLTDLVLVY